MKPTTKQNYWGFYTKPQLISYGGDLSKPWFVQIQFYEFGPDGEVLPRKQVQFKGGINYSKKKTERLADGNAFRAFIEEKLKSDWHPINKCYPVRNLSEYEQWQEKPLKAALSDVQKEISVSPETARCYRLAAKYFLQCAEQLGMELTKIKDVKRSTVFQIWNSYTGSDFSWNKNLGYLSALFAQITILSDLPANPCSGIKKRKVMESKGYTPPTDDEQFAIKRELITNHYNFYRYILMIYHTGMRPKEILALKISDIDFQNHIINIIPDRDRDNAKTANIRHVPINNFMWKYLEQMRLDEFPASYFVFGSPAAAGRGWTGIKSKGDYFLPSPVRVKRDTVTRKWKEIVKDKLGFDCDMYGLKHKGTDDKLLAGMSIRSLKELYGHSSSRMTERYASKLFEIHSQEIVSKSPAF